MCAFFEGRGGHDGEVDGTAEVDEVFFGHVLDDGEHLGGVFFVVGGRELSVGRV